MNMKKRSPSRLTFRVILLYLIFASLNIEAQEVVVLWEGDEKPYYKKNALKEYEKEMWGTKCLFDITEPTLTIYPSVNRNSAHAVMIIPGGGYEMVAIKHEGHDLAKYLANKGITATVLKYRIPKTESSDRPHLVPLSDARRALKLLRQRADKYGFDRSKVGLIGFSAGSHLATVLGLWKSEDENENPNFSALIYGVTDGSEANLKWLEESLYHRKLSEKEVEQNTLLNLVNEETPPAFLVHAYDDDVCHVRETTLYAQKLFENLVPVETHLFLKGGHGFGMGRKEDGTDQWVDLFVNWAKRLSID
ncbi:MAG: acetyl esterase/lipase [Cyclobacteriaceae bacterium]|jgi:acetyl esterase/lipase